jgi:hypothetical protein
MEFDSIKSDISKFNQLSREAEQAEAYIRITDEHGPSQQLIDFINYDGKLGQELDIGLESLGLDDVHLLLKMQLDPAAISEMATESLNTALDKLAKRLKLGGGVAAAAGLVGAGTTGKVAKSLTFAGVGLAAIVAGKIVQVANNLAHGNPPSYTYYRKWRDQASKIIAIDKFVASAIPSSFDRKAWEDYGRELGSDSEAHEKLMDVDLSYLFAEQNRAPVEHSGWTEATFKQEVKNFLAYQESVDKAKKALAPKIKKLQDWAGKGDKWSEDKDARFVQKKIAFAVGEIDDVFAESDDHLRIMKKVLDEVGKHFKEEKKD